MAGRWAWHPLSVDTPSSIRQSKLVSDLIISLPKSWQLRLRNLTLVALTGQLLPCFTHDEDPTYQAKATEALQLVADIPQSA